MRAKSGFGLVFRFLTLAHSVHTIGLLWPIPAKQRWCKVANTLTFRRFHPGGGPLGRCSYGLPGVAGIVVFDVGLFPGGEVPSTITVDCTLAEPVVRPTVARVTSAVVAKANVQQAQVSDTAIAAPAEVAQVAKVAASHVVAAAKAAAANIVAASASRKAEKVS